MGGVGGVGDMSGRVGELTSSVIHINKPVHALRLVWADEEKDDEEGQGTRTGGWGWGEDDVDDV